MAKHESLFRVPCPVFVFVFRVPSVREVFKVGFVTSPEASDVAASNPG